MVSEYERQRDANIARNKALLKSLGLDTPLFEPKEKIIPKPKAPKKRKEPPTPEESGPTRRSARNRGKKVDYKSEQKISSPMPISFQAGIRVSGNEGPLGSGDGVKRKYNPKVYGHIPHIEVGTWWETREGCSNDAIHAPWVGGIAVGPQGAYSVALSGGYDDDVDLGYAFTYTGSGGRDLKGTKAAPKNLRTAPQSSDQDFDNNFNRTLQRSSETKKPVRVIRGYKLKSPYGPSEGYRYDGLYEVEKAWSEKGLNKGGFMVCKFAFKRLPGQPPLPRRAIDGEDATPVDESVGETKDEESAVSSPSEEA
ncbi:PUA-like domain-containing protein [Mucidula mucida]|nr:PUA-like domain-containing protein [Mucidula mucida]